MTLDEKREVIECLLCGTDWLGENLEAMSDTFSPKTVYRAIALRDLACREMRGGYSDIEFDTCEAAYRLIASDRALRREWFGR